MKHSRILAVRLSKQAAHVVREVYNYTADLWGIEQARRYDDLFIDAFSKIACNPKLGHQHLAVPAKYLTYPVGKHMLVYYTDASRVYIIAIFHQNMDIATRIQSLLSSHS